MNLKALIIDDERHDRESLIKDIECYCPNINVVGSFSDAIEGMKAIHKEEPDLIFLDIIMHPMDGITMLECLGKDNINFDIIFTTAHSEYGVKAFEFSALHYLLKPIGKDDLINAVQRVQERLGHIKVGEHINIMEEFPLQIALPISNGYSFKKISTIVYCKADGNYTYIFFEDGTNLLVTRPLKKLTSMLNKHGFKRPHHSYLVNCDHLKELNSREKFLILKNGKEIPISKNKRKDFLKDIL